MQRVQLEPTYVLFTRAYRDSSLIVELFCQHYGRISAVAKKARGPKSRYKGLLQPFTPLLVDWYGSQELKTLGAMELNTAPTRYPGKRLFSAYYLNELIFRLLPKADPYESVFFAYGKVLNDLSVHLEYEPDLRLFERHLIESLGYGMAFDRDCDSGEPIQAHKPYYLIPNRGFLLSSLPMDYRNNIYSGEAVLAFDHGLWKHPSSLMAAKYIMRTILAYHLGDTPLNTRQWFVSPKGTKTMIQ